MSKRKQKKQGFSLIESLLAIGVLIVGILSAFILVVRSLSNIPLIQSRLIAANLAQEGIELVRQKRDTNNLNGLPWTAGFNKGCICPPDLSISLDPACYYEISADDRILRPYTNTYLAVDDKDPEDWKYNYSYTGKDAEFPFFFKRKIEICFPINSNGFNEMRVKAFLEWRVKRNNFSLVVEDHLFNYFNTDNF